MGTGMGMGDEEETSAEGERRDRGRKFSARHRGRATLRGSRWLRILHAWLK